MHVPVHVPVFELQVYLIIVIHFFVFTKKLYLVCVFIPLFYNFSLLHAFVIYFLYDVHELYLFLNKCDVRYQDYFSLSPIL